jgi:hypothetical protein
MKLAVLAIAIFNNLLFRKATPFTTIYYDLNILTNSPCLSKYRYSEWWPSIPMRIQ